MSRAFEGHTLVLGGGGVAGIAWITGLLAGMADEDRDVSRAARVIGTSAGSAVGAQLGGGLGLDELYARQTEPSLQAKEIAVELDLDEYMASFTAAVEGAVSAADLRRRVGGLAREAKTVTEAERRAVIADRLPSHEWPAWPLQLVAVDVDTGEPRLFDRDSGVGLVDAVAASCAVPGVWPPVTIDGRRYMDGGVRSSDNADYAAGASRVLIVSPLGDESPLPTGHSLTDVIADLRAAGAAVALVTPDDDARVAFGTNPLDPATRGPAAAAGRAQGRLLSLPELA